MSSSALFSQQNNVIDISSARKKLSSLISVSFMKGKTFIITKRDIPMAKIVPLDKKDTRMSKTTTLDTELFGVLKDDIRFSRSSQKLNTQEISQNIRSTAWKKTENQHLVDKSDAHSK